MRLGVVAVLVTVFYSVSAQATVCPVDTYCYYIPPADVGATTTLELSAPHGTANNVQISVSGGAPAAPITVDSQLVTQTLPGLAAIAYGTVGTRGGYVFSNQPLVVTVRNDALAFNDRFVVKPSRMALGTRFRAIGYGLNGTGSGNQGFDTIAIHAPTGASVTITPPATTSFADGFGGVATVGVGGALLVRSQPGQDLSGALITADKPIAVLTGGRGYSEDAAPCTDAGYENLVPTKHGGNDFMVYDQDGAANPAQELVYIIADEDDTQVSISNGGNVTLDAGDVHALSVTAVATEIVSDKLVQVYQMSAAAAICDYGLASVPPVSFVVNLASPLGFRFTSPAAGDLAVLVPGNVDGTGVALDGSNTGWTVVTPVVTNGPYFMHRAVAQGFHSITSTHDLQVRVASGTAVNTGSTFDYHFAYRLSACGNGVTTGAESCDDGNVFDFDTCSTTCQLEDGEGPCTTSASCADGTACNTMSSTCAHIECATNPECVTAYGAGATCATSGFCELAAPTIDSPLNNAVTNQTTPTYRGTGPLGVTLRVFIDATQVGTTTVNATTGNWQLVQPTALALGDHDLLVTAVAGTLSVSSGTAGFTVIDGCVPADCTGPAPICAADGDCVQCEVAGDCGVAGAMCVQGGCEVATPVVTAPADGATTTAARPEIAGTAFAGATISVILDNSIIGTTTANGSGAWAFTPSSDLNRGAHTVRARAGSGSVQSAVSNVNSFTVIGDCASTADCATGATCNTTFSCTVAAPVVQTPANAATINIARPTFNGTATAGTTITVIVDASTLGTTTTTADGTWSFAANATLALGAHTVQATARAGTVVSTLSNTNTFTIVDGCLVDADCPAGELCNGELECVAEPTAPGEEQPGPGSTVGGGGFSCSAGGPESLVAVAMAFLVLARRRFLPPR